MQLSEADAYAILQEHCTALHGRLVFLPREFKETHNVRKWMAVECLQLTDEEIDGGLGVRLRLALEIVNAMCSCAGFEPHANLPFWRHAVCSLFVKYPTDRRRARSRADGGEPPTPELCEFLPLEKTAFSHVSIDVVNSAITGLTTRVCSLWQQLAGVSTDAESFDLSAAKSALARVESFVGGDHVRPLHLTLNLPIVRTLMRSVDRTTVTGADIPAYVSTIETIGTHGVTSSARVVWSLGLSCLKGSPEHLSWWRRLASAHASVQPQSMCVDFEAAQQPSQALALRRARGQLLSTFVLDKKGLQSLEVFWRSGVQVTGEVFSLVRLAATTGFTQIVVWDVHASSDFCAWLAFALLRPETKRQSVEVVVRLGPNNTNVIDEALLASSPLRPVAERQLAAVTISDLHLEWYRPGEAVAVVLSSNASAFVDPRCTRSTLLTTVTEGARLDAVVVLSSRAVVGVVVPAYGLCWVAADAVVIARVPAVRQTSAVEVTETQALRDLDTIVRLPLRAKIEVAFRNGALVSLTISHADDPMTAAVFRSLLRSCRSLRHLKLERCRVDSIDPLVSAYGDRVHPSRISDLWLSISGRKRGAPLDWVPLMEMLADPMHPSAHVLTHFAMDSVSRSMMEDFASVLQSNRSLTNVFLDYLGGTWTEIADEKAAITALFDPFQGQNLADGRGRRLGMLSAVRYADEQTGGSPRLSVLCSVDVVALRVIFEFVGPTVVRHVGWRHPIPTAPA